MTARRTLRVGARGSTLAQVQTRWVLGRLASHHPDLKFDVVTLRTTGDIILDRSLDRVGGKGLFTDTIERAIMAREIDFAVHSLKDLPTLPTPGLILGAVPEREDPRDALVGCSLRDLEHPDRAIKIGTCSLRRIAQLQRRFAGIEVVSMRGNVDTRLRKVREKQVDGAVLALAGLRRLGHESEVTHTFAPDQILPAPGQGALAVQIREDDQALRELLESIHCHDTSRCVLAERAVLARLEGGCQVPVAALAEIQSDQLHLRANVISLDGNTLVESSLSGPAKQPEALGLQLAEVLIQQGADRIISEILREARHA